MGTPPSDTRPHGVFATRFPRRPNPVALTVVEPLRPQRSALSVHGLDMADGAPILDIEPNIANVPPEHLCRGWLDEAEQRSRAGSA